MLAASSASRCPPRASLRSAFWPSAAPLPPRPRPVDCHSPSIRLILFLSLFLLAFNRSLPYLSFSSGLIRRPSCVSARLGSYLFSLSPPPSLCSIQPPLHPSPSSKFSFPLPKSYKLFLSCDRDVTSSTSLAPSTPTPTLNLSQRLNSRLLVNPSLAWPASPSLPSSTKTHLVCFEMVC